MTAEAFIAPLRIANEAFMVASTIERCPRQMMLRELVMNALEAAVQAIDAPKRVRIDDVTVDGAPKLRIWNTGRGLSQAELLQISDLSSSLFKTVSLDGNFGMGAKAASLSSNKHGLRYRSCRLGKVSQIVLGAREGVYGRLLQIDPVSRQRREVIDVTADSASRGEDLSHDWTEVTLLGNAPEQNTAADPYAGDPLLPRDWVTQTLGRRFMRLPEGVDLAIEPGASGAATREIFASPLAPASFDRMEAVEAENGVVIHYGYRAKDSALPPQRVNTVGLGAVVYDGEVYALTEERRWALEAPTYGFTFAARQCTVIVELPHGFGVRPEQYRQFLRFNDGDQHQVQFADFGELVRRHLPPWLKRIIASLLPAEGDYLAEIRDEMRKLLVELGLEDMLRAPPAPRPAEPREPRPEASEPDPARPRPPASPRPPEVPSPPEIIMVEDEADIVEKALGGRAARYYPGSRQVFVNGRYGAFARMRAQLAEEFAPFADAETIERLAKQTSEWAVIQRIARSLLYSIGKPKSGWSADEVKTAQSPETMSLMVDDIDPLLAPARRRMAAQLGQDVEIGEGLRADPAAQRSAAELADAEARLQRAKAGNELRLGPLYRQIGTIHIRQRNFEAARAWLEKGMEVDAQDPWCRYEYADLLLARNEFDRAAQLATEALELATDNVATFQRRRAEIETRRGNFAQAEALLNEYAAQDPENPWFHYDLATVHLRQGNLDAAAAATDTAVERSAVPSAFLFRRQADIEQRRGNVAAAAALFRQAQSLDPRDVWTYYHLAKLEAAVGRYDAAAKEIDVALALRLPLEAPLHRAQSEIQLQRGQHALALEAADRAISVDKTDPQSWSHLAAVLQAVGDLDRAAQAAAEATRLAPTPSASLYRRQANIEALRGDRKAALAFLDKALALASNEPSTWIDVSDNRKALGDLEGADAAAATAEVGLQGAGKVSALRRRAAIAAKRNDAAAAKAFLRHAMEVAPTDLSSRVDFMYLLLDAGELDAAADMAKEALALSGSNTAVLSRAATVEERRNNWTAAQDYLRRAIAADPNDPRLWSRLANLHIKSGDLSAAREAAEKAINLASDDGEPDQEAAEKRVGAATG